MHNDDRDLEKMFKQQFKAQWIINSINTIIVIIFAMFFYSNMTIMLFLLVVLVVIWLQAGMKLYNLKKAIKKMDKEKENIFFRDNDINKNVSIDEIVEDILDDEEEN